MDESNSNNSTSADPELFNEQEIPFSELAASTSEPILKSFSSALAAAELDSDDDQIEAAFINSISKLISEHSQDIPQYIKHVKRHFGTRSKKERLAAAFVSALWIKGAQV